MRGPEFPVGIAVVALVLAGPAAAAPRLRFDIPAGSLADAVIVLGRQGGASIAVDPALGGLRVAPVDGTMTTAAALSKLLANLPARAERIDGATWRIVARPPPVRPHRRRPALPAVAASGSDIVVTATKRDTLLDRYPGTAYVLALDAALDRNGAGSEAIVARLPTLASTALGPGRNKLFIRGIADSSFNGPSQATVGQYLGDFRLNYNAPDPDLTLVDLAAVEVLEGPQGTLYGAGALGGVLRLVPAPVRMAEAEASVAAGRALTAHGAPSGDVAAVVNVPIIAGTLAVRAVAYASVDGGTIDDAERGLNHVNRTVKAGGRATLRFESAGGWSVEAVGVVQNINSDDAQYAERGERPRTRRSTIAQPFDSDYGLAGVAIAHEFDNGLSLRSANGIVLQDVGSTYDFTPDGGAPTLFRQNNRLRVISSETRLSRRDSEGVGWVAGISILRDSERLTRLLGPVASPARILGVANTVTDIAGFGEFAFRLSPRLTATVGGRLDYVHPSGEVVDQVEPGDDGPGRDEFSVLPSLALAWQPRDGTTLFARYQLGFRPGDLAVSASSDGLVAQRFRGDTMATGEIGGRYESGAFDAALTLSYAHWKYIQADLVDATGLPVTASIGNGRVLGFEGQAGWRPVPAVRLAASFFTNRSRLTEPTPDFADARGAPLPNIAKVAARGSIDFSHAVSGSLILTGGASLRYVGRSRLGVGPGLAFPQGNYFDTAVNLRLGHPRLGISLDATNLLGTTGNRFALGNPFDIGEGRQIVPLRPRTVRLGIDAHF